MNLILLISIYYFKILAVIFMAQVLDYLRCKLFFLLASEIILFLLTKLIIFLLIILRWFIIFFQAYYRRMLLRLYVRLLSRYYFSVLRIVLLLNVFLFKVFINLLFFFLSKAIFYALLIRLNNILYLSLIDLLKLLSDFLIKDKLSLFNWREQWMKFITHNGTCTERVSFVIKHHEISVICLIHLLVGWLTWHVCFREIFQEMPFVIHFLVGCELITFRFLSWTKEVLIIWPAWIYIWYFMWEVLFKCFTYLNLRNLSMSNNLLFLSFRFKLLKLLFKL